jgi:hypothetical protein
MMMTMMFDNKKQCGKDYRVPVKQKEKLGKEVLKLSECRNLLKRLMVAQLVKKLP